jgi:hypothetical protein
MTKYIFYKIESKDPNITDCYVSATVDLNTSVKKHSKRLRKGHPGRLYEFIRNNGGITEWKITPLATYETIYENESIIPIIKHYILCCNATLNYNEDL